MDPAERRLLGDSQQIQELRRTIERLLHTVGRGTRPPAVLLQGETGSGKGLVASTLHQLSQRGAEPFVDVNCAAIPETLLESELFGYERGAFTDARRSKPGLFQTAHRGTLFLDEVGLLPAAMQAKLLTVLEERAVRRLGATHKEPVDVWIVSASNADLVTESRARRFREDLYHRLAVVTLRIPPLRDRGDDVLLLAEHFLAQIRADYGLPSLRLAESARQRLRAYRWPGNVRELANVIERAALLGNAAAITGATLGLAESARESRPLSDRPSPPVGAQDQVRAAQLQDALDATGGNITRTAEALGITRATVRAQMRRFRLRPNPGRVDRAPGSAPAELVASAPEAEGPSVLREAEGPSVLREADAPSAPPALAALARHDRLRWDQRRVAVLRVVFPASAGSAWSSAGRALTVVLDKIEGFGGRVEGLSPTTLEATFGIDPVDDGPRRAAHAALAISRAAGRARGRDPDVSTPSLVIHTGRVLVARMGQSSHVRQDTKESLFQVARALSARATAGEILLSASAAAFLERRFALTPVDPGEVVSERACRLVSHEVSGLGLWGTPSPFVGRRDEMARLRARARTALDGSGQLVAIGGEAGVGKSRLIWEFTRDAGQGWHRVEATCAGGGRNLYHLAAELLKAFFNVGPDEPIGALRARIDAELVAFDEHLRSTMPALLALLDIATDDAQWGRLDPEGRRRGIIGALTGLFVAASRFQPLLLAVEDVHWIDVESQAALEAIATGLGSERILLLVSYRPEYRDPWGHLGHYTGLPLDPLPVGDASELLDTLMGGEAALAPLKGKMIAWTDGNPFFLEETVRSLVESGALAGQRGAYQLVAHVDRLDVPATVEEVLAARIERLLPEDRSVLQTAALIGPVAPLPILRSVVEIDEGRLGAALRRLQAADFIIERITAGSVEISFRHALTHEVARSSLLPDAQHDLHARVLGAMESLYPRPVGEQVDHLAHHAVGGAVWDKALLYARLAGDRALQSFAAGKAVEYFGHAMGALGHLEKSRERLVETVDLHLRLRDALWPLGRLQEILERLQEAEALAAQAEDTRRQGWIACYLAHYHWSAAENEQALAAAERARLIGDALGDPALAAETGFYLGITCLALGDNRRAVQVLRAARPTLDRAIATSQGSFPSPRFALSGRPLLCSWLARSLAELGQFPEGFAVAWEGHQIAEADGSPFGVIAAVSGMGFLYLRKGEPGRARESLEQALELCRTYTFQNWIPTVTANLGLAYVGLGRLAEGIVLLQHSADVSARTKIGATSTLWRIYLAEAYLRDGRCALAGEVARDALALSLGRRERGHEARARWLLGEIEMCGTDPTGGPAEAMYADALGLAGDLGMRPLLVHCHLGLARLQERGGRSTEARAHRERGAAVAAEIEMALPTG